MGDRGRWWRWVVEEIGGGEERKRFRRRGWEIGGGDG